MKIFNKKFTKLKYFKKEFLTNTPFPYLIMDNFLAHSFYKKIVYEISQINKKNTANKKGKSYNTKVEYNKWISKNVNLPKNITQLLNSLNSKTWIKNLEQLSDIKYLVGVKILNKDMSNFHSMGESGFLGSHVDHSAEPLTGYPHVMNIILFLTENWTKNLGGNTVFYNSEGNKIKKKIFYKPNRAVIFLHTPYSFHGVTRIKNNKDLTRSTIYVDYFSKSLKPYEHIPLLFSNKWFLHDTFFKLPSILDYFKPGNSYYLKSKLNYFINRYFK